MISDNEIYAIYGKDLKNFVHMLSKLKSIALKYAKMVGHDRHMTEIEYDNFINSLLHSEIFTNVNILDMQDEFSFYELLKSANININGRN